MNDIFEQHDVSDLSYLVMDKPSKAGTWHKEPYISSIMDKFKAFVVLVKSLWPKIAH